MVLNFWLRCLIPHLPSIWRKPYCLSPHISPLWLCLPVTLSDVYCSLTSHLVPSLSTLLSISLSQATHTTHLHVLLLWPKKCISWFPIFPPLPLSAIWHTASLPYPSSQCSLESERKPSASGPQIFHSSVLSGDFQDVVDDILSVMGQIWMHVAIL